MPIYDISCPKCGEIKDVWAKIADEHLSCPYCGMKTSRLISPTKGICDIEPYFDENLADSKKCPYGQWVTSRQHRKQIMKEKGLAEYVKLSRREI